MSDLEKIEAFLEQEMNKREPLSTIDEVLRYMHPSTRKIYDELIKEMWDNKNKRKD